MTIPEYLMAAPWWHWLFFLLIAAVFSMWRPIKWVRNTHNHEPKHVHTGKETQ